LWPPKSRRGSSVVEAISNEVQLKKAIGKDASLGKSITALANFKVDPAILVSVLGLQANLKETSIVKIACRVEATRIRSCSNK
jgi:hypothetical protein